MIDTHSRKYNIKPITFIAKKFVKYNISANTITLLALIIAIVGSVLYSLDYINYSLLAFIWLSGLFDVLDGKVANLTKKTPFGAFLDIVCDRIVEVVLITSISLKIQDYFYFQILFAMFFISIAVFLTSAIVNTSVTNNKSFHYSSGITERFETFIFISLLVIFNDYYKIIIVIFVVLVIVTITQRIIEVYKYIGGKDE